jgi:histidinol-phosphate aminotransferase
MAIRPSPIKDIKALVRKNVLDMKPYSSARDEFTGTAEVYLDANENPYSSPYNRYPDPLQRALKERIAAIKSVDPARLFVGNGSDEAIDLLIRAFCEPNTDRILITSPTYGMYAVCAAVNAVPVVSMPLTVSFDIDMDAYHRLSQGTKLLFLCSPNNPTGNLLRAEQIGEILDSYPGLVAIDEAYIDFAASPGWISKVDEYPNLVVLQTLSKAWGLAGLRLGIAYAGKPIIDILNKIKYPYNIGTAAQHIAMDALSREQEKQAWVKEILSERERMAKALSTLPIVETIYPSDANFLLVRVGSARETYAYLLHGGIIVRDRSNVTLCEGCLRITIGTPPENNKLISALRLMTGS